MPPDEPAAPAPATPPAPAPAPAAPASPEPASPASPPSPPASPTPAPAAPPASPPAAPSTPPAPAAPSAAPTDPAAPPAAPDYSGLTTPQGLDDGTMQRVREHAAALGLSADQAQAMADRHAASVAQHMQTLGRWDAEFAADAEFGGSDEQRATTGQWIDASIQRFDPTGEVKALLDETGYGRHPAVRRLLARIGQAMQPGQVAAGGLTAQPSKTRSQQLYPQHYDGGKPKLS